jgi:hypothetical protein
MLLVDKSIAHLEGAYRSNLGLAAFTRMLRERYELAGSAVRYLFARRVSGESLLGPDAACLFRVAVRDGALGDGMTLDRCSPHPPWSLEAVVKPAADQVPLAAVVGNHPGNGIEGFVLHHEAPGLCALMVGDGKAWRRVLCFGVRPGAWGYIALVNTGATVTAYVNGTAAASAPVAGLRMHDSALPLQLGNWCGHDRPYHGLIREVRVLRRALSAGEIAASAARIQRRLPE